MPLMALAELNSTITFASALLCQTDDYLNAKIVLASQKQHLRQRSLKSVFSATCVLQAELTRARHDVISFEKQNEVLNEKCREVGHSVSTSH